MSTTLGPKTIKVSNKIRRWQTWATQLRWDPLTLWELLCKQMTNEREWLYRESEAMRTTCRNAFSCQTSLLLPPSLTRERTIGEMVLSPAGRTQRRHFYLSLKKETLQQRLPVKAPFMLSVGVRTENPVIWKTALMITVFELCCVEVTCWAPPPWYLSPGGRDVTCHLRLELQGWQTGVLVFVLIRSQKELHNISVTQ